MDITNVLRAHGIGVGKKLVGDAQPSDVRAGKTFSNADGNDKVGTLPVRATSAQTITPGTASQVLQAGIYDGDITVLGDADLIAANIKNGVNIFGVLGSLNPLNSASGTANSVNPYGFVTVNSLSFKPKIIIIESTDSNVQTVTYCELFSSTTYRQHTGNQIISIKNVSDNGGYVNNTGFQLICPMIGSVRWVAFG
ncbi:hypothetical protein G3578_10145 [Brevibacillus sp. SYP-B805]|uniref:hypothetical protein n=1 Tax=Brevibacillus sp. SYP-B805 TaxID=1578199 RepID=UPI0013EC068C|nr:hypothetical protein [Brevibacillus sp. SYP-B805]NGQ95513.1 hypothetical protein [Brevibacillus sp. SYP-B805]